MPSAITWACRAVISPAASAAAVPGSSPPRSARAVRTAPAASTGVTVTVERSHAPVVSAPSCT